MKTFKLGIIITIVVLLSGIWAFGQYNPHVGGIDLTPNNSTGRPVGTFDCGQELVSTFNFGVDGLTNFPVCGTGLKITISVLNWTFLNSSNAASNIHIADPAFQVFTFSFAGPNTIIATQINPIPSTGNDPLNPIQTVFTVDLKVPLLNSLNAKSLGINVQLTVPSGGSCGTSNVGTDDLESTSGTAFCNKTLPVQFTEFHVEPISDKEVMLTWITNNETLSKQFYVERRIGDDTKSNWDSKGMVLAANPGLPKEKYRFVDNFQGKGIPSMVYYRIKQENTDGTTKYTEIRSVQSKVSSFAVHGYPNPTKSIVNLNIQSLKEDLIKIEVIDVLGKHISNKVIQAKAGYNYQQLDFSYIPSGSYIIKFSGNEIQDSFTILKID